MDRLGTTRDRIIETACNLLEAQGFSATGLNQIVEASGAPKGSLYYYFPDGKEGLLAEAIERAGRAVSQRIRASLAEVAEPAEAIPAFVRTLAGYVEAAGFRAGGPITAVAIEAAATSERLNQACLQAYQLWQEAFAAKLAAGGFSPGRAARLAGLITAAIEGAIVLSRTARSVTPLHQVAEELRLLLSRTAHEA